MKDRIKDPTKDEMIDFLQKKCSIYSSGNEQEFRDDKPNAPGDLLRNHDTKEIFGFDLPPAEFNNMMRHGKRLGVYKEE